MTKYFIQEKYYDKKAEKNAGSKARIDVNQILLNNGYKNIDVVYEDVDRGLLSASDKLKKHFTIYNDWKKVLDIPFHKGDTIVLQFPIIIDSILLYKIFNQLKKKNVNIILLIHDLDLLRKTKRNSALKNFRLFLEEKKFIDLADSIICHNLSMKKAMIESGVSEDKLIELQIFDYLMDKSLKIDSNKYKKNAPLVIAGNLSKDKSKYIYDLPENIDFNLYGVNYEADKEAINVHYKGSFLPDELPQYLEGSFGLVWDGESSKTCTGIFGEYLKINNPHKTSLYLASQLPVIVWKESALASFIVDNGCGIAVNSLYDIKKAIDQLSDFEYEEMKKNVKKMSEKLRSGHFTLNSLDQCL